MGLEPTTSLLIPAHWSFDSKSAFPGVDLPSITSNNTVLLLRSVVTSILFLPTLYCPDLPRLQLPPSSIETSEGSSHLRKALQRLPIPPPLQIHCPFWVGPHPFYITNIPGLYHMPITGDCIVLWWLFVLGCALAIPKHN